MNAKQVVESASGEEGSVEGGPVGKARALVGIRAGEARASFEKKAAAIEAVDASEVVSIKVDARRVSAIAHSVALRDASPERRAVFERLASAKFYAMATLDELPDLARSAWYARQQQLFGMRESSRASVSEAVVSEGYEMRGRMLATLEHWFGDDEKISARLKTIREGSGHLDLASDLEALAALYGQDGVRRVIEIDFKHYRPSDEGDALRVAGALFEGFGMGEESEAARWTGLAQRAITLLFRGYDEHRRCGQFGFFGQEDVSLTYPSLIAAVRNAPSKRAPAEAPDAGEGEAPFDGA